MAMLAIGFRLGVYTVYRRYSTQIQHWKLELPSYLKWLVTKVRHKTAIFVHNWCNRCPARAGSERGSELLILDYWLIINYILWNNYTKFEVCSCYDFWCYKLLLVMPETNYTLDKSFNAHVAQCSKHDSLDIKDTCTMVVAFWPIRLLHTGCLNNLIVYLIYM